MERAVSSVSAFPLRLRVAGYAWVLLGIISGADFVAALVQSFGNGSTLRFFVVSCLVAAVIALVEIAMGVALLRSARWSRPTVVVFSLLVMVPFCMAYAFAVRPGYQGPPLGFIEIASFWLLGLTAVVAAYSIIVTATTLDTW